MPSPIAHAVSGYILGKLIDTDKTGRTARLDWRNPLQAIYPVFVGIFADFDFLVGAIVPGDFHRGPTHSLLFALLFSAIVGGLFARLWRLPFRWSFGLTAAVYGSHLLLDYFTAGGSGIPLLWPFLERTFITPAALFPAVHHSRGLFDLGHLVFVSFELVYAIALWLGFRAWQRHRRSRASQV